MKKYIFLIITIFCMNNSFSMQKNNPEIINFAILLPEKFNHKEIVETNNFKASRLSNNFGTKIFTLKDKSENKDASEIKSIFSIEIEQNSKTNTDKIYSDITCNIDPWLDSNNFSKLFNTVLIKEKYQKSLEDLTDKINSYFYKNLNKIFEISYNEKLKDNIKDANKENKKIELKNIINKLISLSGFTLEIISDFLNYEEPEKKLSFDKEQNLREIDFKINKSIEILNKENKTLLDYLLFAKITNNKKLFRAISNSIFIIEEIKKFNSPRDPKRTMPNELAGLIMSFANIESFGNKKILESKN